MRIWLASLFLAVPLLACSKKEEPKAEPAPVAEAAACPGRFRELSSPSGEVSCRCAQGTLAGPVWGTATYTTDSVICTAAVHAGAISQSGGTVRMKALSGCDGYKGSQKNGVTSSNWGNYDSSFYFVGHGDGKCEEIAKDACPASYNALAGVGETTEHSCSCAPNQLSGSVWGSGIYTRDSSICQAALHAGVITAAGGSVKAKSAAGCPSYKGSVQNGVTTSPWQSFGGSFFFPGKGTGECQ